MQHFNPFRSLAALVVALALAVVGRVRAFGHAARVTLERHGLAVFEVPAVKASIVATLILALFAFGVDPAHAMAMGGLSGLIIGEQYPDDAAGLATAEVQETFKRAYVEAVDAIPDSTPLTAQLNRTRKFKGAADALYFHVKLETGGPVANVRDSGLLPRPGRPKGKQGKSSLCHTYTVVAVGGQSIQLTKDTRNAFVSNLETQLEDGLTRVQNDVERQYNGDGQGILCVISSIAGAPTYGVEDPYGVNNAGPGTMLLIEDMDVAAINPATGLERDRSKLASIDADADEITTEAALAGAQIGDYLALCNDVGAAAGDQETNYGNEAAGILAVCSDDMFENIDGAQHRRWRATQMTTATLNELAVSTLDARIRTKSGKKPSLYYTSPGGVLVLQEKLAERRRNTGETIELKGGYGALNINNRAVLEGPWAPKGHFFALNTEKKVAGMVDVVKMGYIDLDGAKLHRIQGRHAYRADLYFPHQALWMQRNCHGVITGWTDDNTITR